MEGGETKSEVINLRAKMKPPADLYTFLSRPLQVTSRLHLQIYFSPLNILVSITAHSALGISEFMFTASPRTQLVFNKGSGSELTESYMEPKALPADDGPQYRADFLMASHPLLLHLLQLW